MNREKPILVLACLFVVLKIALTEIEICPSMEDVFPCTCGYKYWRVAIRCHGIANEELAMVASNLRGKNVYSFTIENSTLGFIPHDIFEGFKLSQLKFENSTLVALTDRSEAFFGLEEHLQELYIWNCVLKNEWDWTVLRNLKKLNFLSIYGSLHPETIGTDVMKSSVPNVEKFTFSFTNITLTNHAFNSYKNIKRLDLSYNKIKNVERTILPNPALELASFDLSDNLIEQFPEDMFTNMPNLSFIYIGNNKILVLDEKTFSPIWGQLISLDSSGNAHHCGCQMTWILWKRSRSVLGISIYGECASPPQLRGNSLQELKSRDLNVMCKTTS